MPALSLPLLTRERLSADVYLLNFRRPPGFDFEPGQFLRFHLDRFVRDYTLVNAPGAGELSICVKHLPTGAFTPTLMDASPGQTFSASGPHGYFRFQADRADAVFVATGTGIAPFVAFVRAGVRGFTLLQGAPAGEALLFQEELQAAAGLYRACLSALPEGDPDRAPAWQVPGRVTELLRTLPVKPYRFYLCGGRAMIGDAMRIIDERFEGAPIFTETFY